MVSETAQEPVVVSAKPVVLKRVKATLIRENIWLRQSGTVKTAIILLVCILMAGSFYYYNLFITELFSVRLESAQLVAEIDRKNFLIPGLAQVVEEYMAFEGRTFTHTTDVRNALAPFKEQSAGGTRSMDMETFTRFKTAISQFQAVAEGYPALKSSEAYLKLMLELANTEVRMANTRYRYNQVVNRYNTQLNLLPGCIFGYVFGFKQAQIFVADAR